MRTRALPSTVIVSPSTAVILPRTRVGAWAAAVAAASTRRSASLLRRLDAIFAHRHARRHELAVAFDARAAEDCLAGLEIGARPWHEGHDLGLRRHQNFLLAVLVLERDLVAAAHLCGARDVGVGHQRVRSRVPGTMRLV